MNLVFKKYINFLKDNGLKYELKEGCYWYDKSIIKAYDKEGNTHKIFRIYIDDDLNLSFKFYKEEQFEIENWQETVERNKERLLELEKNSLSLISNSIKEYSDRKIAVPSSGGKDSSVVTYLVKQVKSNPEIIFNNTTLDVADTYLHIKKEDNLTIINPKEGFYQWRDRLNFIPTRFARSCCSIFKEGAMINYLSKDSKYLFFMGMRNDESSTRSGYTDSWRNTAWGNREWNAILPIRKWTEVDIWLYILMREIDINPKYKKGYSRCGCGIACPYYNKSTWILDRYWYPKLYNRWHNILENDFVENKKAPIMNCTLEEYHLNWNGGMVRNTPTEEVIEEFAEQQSLDIEIAKKYFNKTCSCCNKKLKKDDVGLSMKLYGRQIKRFKCVKCIAKDYKTTTKELKERIEHFKNSGCSLF
ncbi:phosphoadenosine phosphosulfate reductase family protein [Clostridium paraputrificum]|uniref:phosphoadenosine phosphosulfate reductase family protein n=1 Tax=Clostridium paraputrificum TaxID=29363 RepID=UPI001A9AABE1|nr:phosphoadenosine phosphosulfate reductase family protein [Clostridium paraputrificum]